MLKVNEGEGKEGSDGGLKVGREKSLNEIQG
jgi:hypothetical protein